MSASSANAAATFAFRTASPWSRFVVAFAWWALASASCFFASSSSGRASGGSLAASARFTRSSACLITTGQVNAHDRTTPPATTTMTDTATTRFLTGAPPHVDLSLGRRCTPRRPGGILARDSPRSPEDPQPESVASSRRWRRIRSWAGARETRKAVAVEPGARLAAVLHVLPHQEPRRLIESVLKRVRRVAGGFEPILGRNLVDHLSHPLATRWKRRPESSHEPLEGEVPDRAARPVRTVREYRELVIRLRPDVFHAEPDLVQHVLPAEREEDVGRIEHVVVQDEVREAPRVTLDDTFSPLEGIRVHDEEKAPARGVTGRVDLLPEKPRQRLDPQIMGGATGEEMDVVRPA